MTPSHQDECIAIIGAGLRLPQSESLDTLWSHLTAGRCLITDLPARRWDAAKTDTGRPVRGGFIEDADGFDAAFFNISPREAAWMDPQQRFALELAWKAIEDAGYPARALAGTRTGVYIGVCHWDYAELLEKHLSHLDAYTPTGIAFSIIANRVSHFFDLRGPSIANDTACAASITSVYEAVRALQTGECELALAGGVNLIWSPNHFVTFARNGMLSREGASRAFDQRADGYVRGEGGAMLLLKPLARALADGDPIHAVIRGVGVNHGGRTNSLTVTNPQAQADLIVEVIRQAGVSPDSIDCIEAHGTGTPLGDPIEIAGLKRAFAQLHEEAGTVPVADSCAVGSVKTNIGHLEGAAGVAGIVKVLAALRHDTWPANADFDQLSSLIDLSGSPLWVAGHSRPWPRTPHRPRRAGVSSFGFGGSNGHVLLEEAPARAASPGFDGMVLVPLSARDPQRLQAGAAALLAFVQSWQARTPPGGALADLAWTLQFGREAMTARVVFLVDSPDALARALRAFIDGAPDPQIRLPEGVAAQPLPDPLEHAAARWLQGGEVAWVALQGGRSPQRLHAPGYSFARERHWMDLSQGVKDLTPVLHPLLQRNVSQLGQQCYQSHFSGQEFFWAEHLVGTEQVLPGVTCLEMARAAWQHGTGSPRQASLSLSLDGLVWVHAIRAAEAPVAVEIRLSPRSGGSVAFEVTSGAAARVANVQGTVQPMPDSAAATPTRCDLERLRTDSTAVIESDRLYQRLHDSGMHHGPSFQAVTRLWRGEGYLLASLKLPRRLRATLENYPLHPVLLDAAIQAWAGFDVDRPAQRGAAVPFACRRIEVTGPCEESMWALLTPVAGGAADATLKRFDIALCDRQGLVRVQFRELALRLMGETGATHRMVQAVPRWLPLPLPLVTRPGEDGTDTRIVTAGLPEALAEALASRSGLPLRVLPVVPASADPAVVAQQWFRTLRQDLADTLRGGSKRPQQWLVLVPAEVPDTLTAALASLLRTVEAEQPRLNGAVLRIEGALTVPRLAAIVAAERARPDRFTEIRHDAADRRLVLQQTTVEPPAAAAAVPRMDAHGVVWITGGLGGLGLHFATWLVARGVRRIVLSGRGTAVSRERLAPLERAGGPGLDIRYRACDVASQDEVDATVRWIVGEVGPLKGIVHAAGVLHDGYLLTKDAADVAAVFAPKVAGLVHLDHATRDTALDFMLLCSSIAGVLGNPAQADYGAANAFMDAFAVERSARVSRGERHGTTVAIAWPLWADGGMQVDDATRSALQRRFGTVPMPTAAGLAALDRLVVAGGPSRVLLQYGAPDRIEALRTAVGTADAQASPLGTAPATAPAPDQPDQLRPGTVGWLKDLLSELIQMDARRIRSNRKLEEYGLDSITIVEMTNRMEDALGPLSKTLFFEYVDLDSLADHLIGTHAQALAALLASTETAPLSTPLDAPPAQAPTAAEHDDSPPAATPSPGIAPGHDIAIIGMSLRVGGASDLERFWHLLEQGLHGFERYPSSRWNHEALLHAERDVPGKTVVRTGAFLEGIDEFDPRYFRISQAEAELMSPEVRLFLQSCVDAFEEAGYSRETLQRRFGGDVAVIVGSMNNEYNLYGFQNMLMRGSQASGSYTGTIPNMVSYYYGFTGPSYFLDTMCSGAATCLHEAVQMLRTGRCQVALAGGINLLLHPQKLIATSQEHFTTKTAEVIRGYGLGADGTILGEGIGAFVMKRLEDALRDGDHVHGVIKGTGISNAGVRNGFTVPSPQQQASAIEKAWQDAGIDPRTLGYIEGHGSGTSLGDPIEVKALTQAFAKYTDARQICPIGTVKSNVAHLLHAAVLPGIAKVLLQMKHGLLVPSLHAQELNPNIDFTQTPVFVQRERTPWRRQLDEAGRERPLRAGVTSIGAGGMNAHIVLEEYRPSRPVPAAPPWPAASSAELCVFSAMTPAALRTVLTRFCAWLERQPASASTFADIAWTLQEGRNELPCRLAVVADGTAALLTTLRGVLAAPHPETSDRLSYSASILDHDVRVEPEVLRQALGAAQWPRLGLWWSQGVAIDWCSRPRPADRQRVSLPTYPFEKVRCWYPSYPDAPSVVEPLGARNRLHPFIGSNRSDLHGVRYQTTLYRADLLDYVWHQERRSRLLPLVLTDIMGALARVSGVGAACVIERLEVARAVAWSDGDELTASVTADGPGAWQLHLGYRIAATATTTATAESEAEPLPFARASVKVSDPAASRSPQSFFDLPALRRQAQAVLDRRQVYEPLAGRKLTFKPYLEVLTQAWRLADGGVLCAVESHPVQQDHLKRHLVLPPRLLGAAWQAILLIQPEVADLVLATMASLQCRAGADIGRVTHVLVQPRRDGPTHDVSFLDDAGAEIAALHGLGWRTPGSLRAFTPDQHPVSVPALQLAASASASASAVARSIPVPVHSPRERLTTGLRQLMADLLKFPLEDVSPRALFHDLGFDSISLTRLASEVNARYGGDVTAPIFFQCEHADALAGWLITRIEADSLDIAPATVPPTPPSPAPIPAPDPAPPTPGTLDLAIIGLAARLPGADSADEFFQHLLEGRDLVGPLPLERYGADYQARIQAAGFPLQGGFLDNVDRFDAAFFKTSPHEASRLDPQQRLMLETAWHAIENAGYLPDQLGADTGVFVGVSGQDYARVLQAHGVETDGYVATGNSLAMVANRLSWHLNLSGPSEAVDTACSSSLVALLRAADAIRSGQCRMAVVGGVNLALAVEGFEGPWKAGMLSPQGRCRTFSAAADGYVRGEGVVALLVKSRAEAERDGDRILGLVIGGAQNHGGHAGSLTSPNAKAQAALVREAMRGIAGDSIGYIEAHGTGTRLGDPVEVNGLRLAYEQLLPLPTPGTTAPDTARIGLGALKSGIGHLEAAAGLAGVVKVLLAMRAGELPPTLHAREVNPYIDLADSPFFLVRERQPWPLRRDAEGRALPCRAGVSSFGFGGSNAHVVLQAPAATVPRRQPLPPRRFAETRYWIPGHAVRAKQADPATLDETVMLRPQWQSEPQAPQPPGTMAARRRLILPCDFPLTRIPPARAGALIAVAPLQGDLGERYQTLAAALLAALRQEIRSGREDEVLVQLLVPLGDERAVHEGLGAMLDTAHAECPRLLGQVVGVSSTVEATAALALLDAEARQPTERRVRHVEARRLVRRWTALASAPAPAPAQATMKAPAPWRAGGSYLITGGMGALGLLVAREIAGRAPGARLMLVGSAPMDARRQDALADLQRLGAVAVYRQADVTDRAVMVRVVGDALRLHGGLHGVIHCAGLHRDSAIIRKSADQLRTVLAPKVGGAIALREACRGLALEHFVLFSSLAGATGNPGQADYAAANGFLDALANHEAGAMVSLDWPLWREGGMKPTPAGERALFDLMGQRPLSTPQGLAALDAALRAGSPQVAVVGGDGERIRAFFRASEGHVRATPVARAEGVGEDQGRLLDRVGLALRALLAQLSGLAPQAILLDEALEHYGIDSLMIGKLNDALRTRFGPLSSALFFEHRTLRAVAQFLVHQHASACRDWTGMTAATTVTPLAPVTTPSATDTRPTTALREPIAIIGISGRYPGAGDLDTFWRHLAAGHDAITDMPPGRWSMDAFGPADPDESIAQGRSYARRGGFLEDFSAFDPLFFRISPREAAAMDPQERLFLMTAWAACEDAGYTRQRLAARHGSRVGVFVGVTKTGYALHGPQRTENGGLVRPTTSFASVANRVSHVLDLNGPSLPVDTMCSSSLTAIHEACEHLHAGACEVALAGGVNLYLHPSNFVELSAARMLSPDGVCRSFGEGANGFVPGEGVGCVVLKPLSRALADGDSIHALVRGSAINHGGRVNGYTVPNPVAQREVVRAALRCAGLPPSAINCIEAHGTGTELGDPVEFAGLVQALQSESTPAGWCALGSVKSGIGHLEAAAGMAGLTKVVLQMRHQQLAPTLHAAKPNPHLRFEGTPFVLQQTLAPWNPVAPDGTPQPRIAGISSFGAGGANAHVIVEEWPTTSLPSPTPRPSGADHRSGDGGDRGVWPILLSARTDEALRTAARQLLVTLAQSAPQNPPSPPDAAAPRLEHSVCRLLADVLGVGVHDLDIDETFDSIGLASVQRQALRHACEHEFDLTLEPAAWQWLDSIAAVATELRQRLPAPAAITPPATPPTTALSLRDLAWTLQVGREAMDCRLAIVAGTLSELEASLRGWLAGADGAGRVWSATVGAHRDALGPLLGEAELDAVLARWLAAGDLPRVLGLWVRGLDIDWARFTGASDAVQPRILHLPTYPFAREHFWITPPVEPSVEPSVEQPASLAASITAASAALAPLHEAHERLERELGRLVRAQLAGLSVPATGPWRRWHTALEALLTTPASRAMAVAEVAAGAAEAWVAWEAYQRHATATAGPVAQIALAESCVRALPDLLAGRVQATDVMFPAGRLTQVEAVYKHNAVASHFNDRLATAVAAFVAQRRGLDPGARLRILEVGAGTGGTTQRVLAHLAPHAAAIAEYRYTDLSRAFLIHGERQFSAEAPYLRTALFDAERPPAGQDVQAHAYDLVIAANVLHATRDMLSTLEHVHGLLAPGGVLLLNETSRPTLFTHLTFGLLEGWWRFTDPARRLPGSPSLAPESWRQVLTEAGFDWLAGTPVSDNALGQQVLAAVARPRRESRPVTEVGVSPVPAVQAVQAVSPPRTPMPLRSVGLRAVLVAALAKTLNVAPDAIDVARAFADYGLDSILGAELVHALRTQLGVRLEQIHLFDATTVVQLEAFLRHEHPQAVERVESMATAPTSVPVPNRVAAADPAGCEPIAIVGISGRFAGADDIQQLWQHLLAGHDLVRPVDRFDLQPFATEAAAGGNPWCQHGSFIDGIEQFDAAFFNISGLEATYMDPQQRLFLEQAWLALEHAGHAGAAIEGRRCGVFVGCAHGDYQELFQSQPPGQAFWGNTCSLIPARIAYHLNLKGPALAVDTACSSSLVAVHLACQSLWSGESELALAGGVFVQASPRFYRYANQARMLSPGGRCAAFGADADGIVPGEAVVALLLRPLSQALADGDTVHGLIVASGMNQDGATNGITAPSAQSQEQLIRSVYQRHGIDAARIGMVEAHGTGTVLGDPIEHAALSRAFRHWTEAKGYCALGSVKSNLGHATTAAGATGLVRVLLALQHQTIPPTLHARPPNPALRVDDGPFFLNDTPVAWPATPQRPRQAAVSSFGFGGTNAHVVLQEAPPPAPTSTPTPDGDTAWLVPLSARSAQQLRVQVEQLLTHLGQAPGHGHGHGHDLSCIDIAFTLCVGRRHLARRLALVVADVAELRAGLADWLARDDLSGPESPAPAGNGADQAAKGESLLRQLATPGTAVDRDGVARRTALKELGALFMHGGSPALERLFDGVAPRRVPLPSRPFSRKRYWVAPSVALPAAATVTVTTAAVPLAPVPPPVAAIQGTPGTRTSTSTAASGHRVRLVDPSVAPVPASAAARHEVRITLTPLTPVAAQAHPVVTSGEVVRLDDVEGVRRLQVRGPVDAGLLQALAQALQAASTDESVRAVLLLDGAEGWDGHAPGLATVASPLDCALPVIAAPASAAGAGFLLALHCDFLVLATQGRYACPSWLTQAQSALLQRRFGAERLARLRSEPQGLTGARLAVTHQTAPATEIADRSLELARQIAAAPRVSVVELKRHMRHGPQAPVDLPVPSPLSALLDDSPVPPSAHAPRSRPLPLASRVMSLDLFDDGVVVLRMEEREHRNTFTPAFMAGMEEAFALIARTPDCKVVVLTGHDHYFACGGTRQGLESLQRGASRFTDREIYSLPLACDLPVIAAMQGHAIGAGWSLGLFCDHTLYASESVCHSNYMWYGFTPGAGATLVFPHRLGDDLGREILFTAHEYKGRELATRAPDLVVCAAAQVLPRAMALAHRMAHESRQALQAAKQARAAPLRAMLGPVFERELAMHQTTFIGNARVMERVASVFPAAVATPSPAAVPVAPAADRGRLRTLMARTLAEELMIEAQDITDGAGFLELGLDSILAVTWIRKLNAQLALATPLAATSVYAHPTFGALLDQVARLAVPPATAVAPAAVITPSPAAVPVAPAADRSRLRALMARTLAEELMIEAQDITDGAGFLELGLDSILAVTWIRKLNAQLALVTPLAATSVYAHPTFGALLDQVARLAPAPATPTQVSTPAPIAAPIPAPLPTPRPPETPPVVQPLVIERVTTTATIPAPAHPEPIAIIGASGRFPLAPDLDAFWHNLSQGRDCIREVPASRWDIAAHFDADPQAPGKSYSKWMGAIDDIDRFDAAFFNITAREAQLMDPQQRLFLQHAWHAIEDAAIVPADLAGSRCGIFVGSGDSGYSALTSERNAYSLIGRSGSILAARIAYLLDLRGPSVALDTACSTSLVAIASACDSLVAGNSDLALAGGACVLLGPDMHIDTSKVSMLSPDGRCHSFDHRANGFVPGEGVGVLLLKRLRDAERDGDPIRAVVRGWGVNQDGRTNGITAPNPQAQAELIRGIHQRFAIDPASIGLIEAHGTGTPLGDPIEVEGLNAALSGVDPRQEIALGSVKSNVGHLLAAAGVAGAIKAMLALEHGEWPPTLHFERANEHLALQHSPLRVNTTLRPWPAPATGPRRAGVSAFGFSGTNAHLVLQAAPRGRPAQTAPNAGSTLLCVLSARSKAALAAQAGRLAAHVQARADLDLADLAHTLQTGRSAFEFRAAALFQDRATLLGWLQSLATGMATPGAWHGSRDAHAVALFEEDADGRELVGKWLATGRLDPLADAWTKGVRVDWRALPGAARRHRLHLPGYAFTADRHWVEPAAAPTPDPAPVVTRLHPLIDRNASTLDRARFAGRFSGEEVYLSHYVRGAERLLLGLFYPEMARAAGEMASGQVVRALRCMVWGRPATINGRPRDLSVVLAPGDEGLLYRICPDGDDSRPCHVGELVPEPQATGWSMPVGAAHAPAPTGQDVTAAFRAAVPRASAVQQVLRSGDDLFAQVRMTHDALEAVVIDPLMLDALWALVTFHEHQHGLPGPRFPHALARLLQDGPLPHEGWVRLWRSGGETAGLSLLLSDRQGRACLWLDGLLTERVEALPTLHFDPHPSDDMACATGRTT